MLKMIRCKNRKDWLEHRRKRIGGSDAAAIIGLNPWRTNVELWEIKTGRKEQDDISQEPFVLYGTQAEKYLRELFKLDYPCYRVEYVEDNLWLNDLYPYAHASLDGLLTDEAGRKGILEIKTTNIQNHAMGEKWKDRVPDNYYVQLLHYMAVMEADFAILKAQLKYDYAGEEIFAMTKHYKIERADVQDDIEYLMQAEEEFSRYMAKDTPPPLILPTI